MDERRAREVMLLEAFETAQPASASWSDDDRRWADRVALEAAPPGGAPSAFIATRAGHALQRLASREPALVRAYALPAWRAGAVIAIGLVAFVLGIAADAIGSARLINLLAPPLWGVLVWNLVVYALLIVLPLMRLARRGSMHRGPIVRAAEALLRVRQRLPRVAGEGAAARRFAALWGARSRGLALVRAEAALHIAAAALALGLIAGLYARGLVLDYRAGWESTFLDAATAHALVGTALGPASALSGIALPDAASFAALRIAPETPAAGAPAAPWIHLVALTLGLGVVAPRLVLALVSGIAAAWRSRRFALPLDDPYFQRLLRLGGGAAARVVVFPYAATPSPQATLGLRALLEATFGGTSRLDVRIAPLVAFGAEDDARSGLGPDTTHAIALFDLGATPEAEHHTRFLQTLAAALPKGAVLGAIVDAAAFQRRFAGLDSRLAERREAWRLWGDGAGIAALTVDLESADVASAEPYLQAALARPPEPRR
ncbi:MAG: DUF2868 domain-containing protein [Caldimonas sp.]